MQNAFVRNWNLVYRKKKLNLKFEISWQRSFLDICAGDLKLKCNISLYQTVTEEFHAKNESVETQKQLKIKETI